MILIFIYYILDIPNDPLNFNHGHHGNSFVLFPKQQMFIMAKLKLPKTNSISSFSSIQLQQQRTLKTSEKLQSFIFDSGFLASSMNQKKTFRRCRQKVHSLPKNCKTEPIKTLNEMKTKASFNTRRNWKIYPKSIKCWCAI